MTLLAILGWTLFGLAILIGLALNLVGLFGNWIILGAIAGAWLLTDFEHFGGWALLGLLGLALLGEILEMLMAGYGAKRFGGSKGSVWAALFGSIAGAIFGSPIFPIVGTLIGAVIGAFLFAALYERLKHQKEVHVSVRTGVGAAVGKMGGVAAKLACGIAMLFVAWITYN